MTTSVTPTEALVIAYANKLLTEHKIYDWNVVLDRATRRSGQCRYHKKEIGLSRPMIKGRSLPDSYMTVKHEVAHVLAGPEAGHGPKWKRIFLELGGDGRVTFDLRSVNWDRTNPPYLGECPNGHKRGYFRKLKYNRYCGLCFREVGEWTQILVTDTRTGNVVSTW